MRAAASTLILLLTACSQSNDQRAIPLPSAPDKPTSGRLAAAKQPLVPSLVPKPVQAIAPLPNQAAQPVPSTWAQTLSPGKSAQKQLQIESAVLRTFNTEGVSLERRFKLRLFDDHGNLINLIDNISAMNRRIMRERGWTVKSNNLMNAHLFTDGIDAGMAFYRQWKIENSLPIMDCESTPARVASMQALRGAVCDGEISAADCGALIGKIDLYLARRHPEISRLVGRNYIDDYGVVCEPLDTFEFLGKNAMKSKKPLESARNDLIALHGLDVGLAIYRHLKK